MDCQILYDKPICERGCLRTGYDTSSTNAYFPGIRFSYNPMEGCVEGAYFGKSENGWINTELFYGWLTKHFMRHTPAECPVCLLVDGHTSHIDLETSKFSSENGILLYCLPPHSSHITQPLDVGFFSPLKGAWKKSVMAYNSQNPGNTVLFHVCLDRHTYKSSSLSQLRYTTRNDPQCLGVNCLTVNMHVN